MKTKARQKLDNILNYPFFQAVGEPLPDSITKVESWRRATEECNSNKWKNCRLMARNALQGFTEERNWKRSDEWNLLTDELRPVIVTFVDSLVTKEPVPREVAGKIKNDVCWDIMFICLEHEYDDVVTPFFYIPLLDRWYAAGHFPCGWDGDEFPDHWDGVIRNGRLMAF